MDWPEGNPWPLNAVRPAGTPLGKLLHCLDTTPVTHTSVCNVHRNIIMWKKLPFSWSPNVTLYGLCFHFHIISGPFQIKIVNKKGESVSKMPAVGQGGKKLVIEVKIVKHGKKNKTHSSKHLKSSIRWFNI